VSLGLERNRMGNGSREAPALAFDGEPSLGIFRPASGQLAIVSERRIAALFDADGPVGGVQALARNFIETTGAGVYTATVNLPEGSRILDIMVTSTALWTSASATLDVGDDDDAVAFFDGLDLTTEPGAGLTLSYAVTGTGKFYPDGGTLTATLTTSGQGSAGRTTLLVLLARPGEPEVVVWAPPVLDE
jgi:hypothetical protein